MEKLEMRLGHSPDPDDAFMFYGIASGKVSSERINFVHVVEDIQSLNRRAENGELEMTAVSVHSYLYIQRAYRILSCGASMGRGYGPIVVAKTPELELNGKTVAVPGKLTTAFLLLRLYAEGFTEVEMPFDEIMGAVEREEVDAGLLIHEGQLTFADRGLHNVLDLGHMWAQDTPLPMPLGINVVRRDIDSDLQREILRVHLESIDYGLSHKEEALDYALQFGRGMPADLGEEFVLMYVNDLTRRLGTEGKGALRYLFGRAYGRGLVTKKPTLDILEP